MCIEWYPTVGTNEGVVHLPPASHFGDSVMVPSRVPTCKNPCTFSASSCLSDACLQPSGMGWDACIDPVLSSPRAQAQAMGHDCRVGVPPTVLPP